MLGEYIYLQFCLFVLPSQKYYYNLQTIKQILMKTNRLYIWIYQTRYVRSNGTCGRLVPHFNGLGETKIMTSRKFNLDHTNQNSDHTCNLILAFVFVWYAFLLACKQFFLPSY